MREALSCPILLAQLHRMKSHDSYSEKLRSMIQSSSMALSRTSACCVLVQLTIVGGECAATQKGHAASNPA